MTRKAQTIEVVQNTPRAAAIAPRPSRAASLRTFALRNAMLIILVIVIITASIVYDKFFTIGNLALLAEQNSMVGLVAIGATFIIVTGNFDLSVVSVYVLAAGVFANLVIITGSVPLALVAAVVVGAGIGIVNGVLVTKGVANSFIITLATGSVIGGIVSVYIGTMGISLNGDETSLGTGEVLGVSLPVVILVVAFILGQAVLGHTTFGRSLLTIGDNLQAARLVGLRVDLLRTLSFVISGVTAAVAGAIFVSLYGNVGPSLVASEAGLVLEAIAIVVIGGTSLFGGEGAVWRTAIGLAIFAILGNVFTALAIAPTTANIVTGSVLLIAVLSDSYARRLQGR